MSQAHKPVVPGWGFVCLAALAVVAAFIALALVSALGVSSDSRSGRVERESHVMEEQDTFEFVQDEEVGISGKGDLVQASSSRQNSRRWSRLRVVLGVPVAALIPALVIRRSPRSALAARVGGAAILGLWSLLLGALAPLMWPAVVLLIVAAVKARGWETEGERMDP